MSELSVVSETLYVPLFGRIYASRNCPAILFDEKALALWDQLPQRVKEMPGQNEYTLLASAVRSANIDHYLQLFLDQHPNGTIVNVGCGLETLYSRNDNGTALWFELDLPDVLELRSRYFPEEARDRFLQYSMFDYSWISAVQEMAFGPVMIIAAGLFYYFKEEQVIDFIRHLSDFKDAQLIFDAVSSSGIKHSRRLVKKMGKQEAIMFFSVDSAEDLVAKISSDTFVVEERKFYSLINKNAKVRFPTRVKMAVSDAFNMVKMVRLKIESSNSHTG